MAKDQSQPDAFAKGLAHAAVAVVAAVVASYVIVGIFGIRRNSGVYTILAAGGAMWMHAEYDMPVAKVLGELGL
ncbi:MAG TPA: hypothetical protein VGB75_08840 [Jatrophihabitans sp.]|jgi:hypothetical protein|uniref:hypothetical protein n=1 Tax=Jatrophihabitans sp. TaxID=1932789 RepID=UPI002F0293EA